MSGQDSGAPQPSCVPFHEIQNNAGAISTIPSRGRREIESAKIFCRGGGQERKKNLPRVARDARRADLHAVPFFLRLSAGRERRRRQPLLYGEKEGVRPVYIRALDSRRD